MGFGERWCNIWNCAFVVEDELVMIITELESKTKNHLYKEREYNGKQKG